MKTKILRNIFLSVGVLFALARPLAAGTSDSTDPGQGTQPQARQISVAPLLIGGSQCYAQPVGARIALSEMTRAKAAGRFLWQPTANVQVPLAMGDVITFDCRKSRYVGYQLQCSRSSRPTMSKLSASVAQR